MGISAGEVATASDVRKLEARCHIVTASRSGVEQATAASVDYTGFNFQPTSLVIHSFAGTTGVGWGLYASNTQVAMSHLAGTASTVRTTGKIIDFSPLQANTVTASVTAVSSTGITIFWASGANIGAVHADILGIGDTY